MKSLIMKIPVRILAGVIALAFVGANEEVQAQNYYWKDYNNNGQWDWSNNQWYGSSQNNFVGAPQSDGGAIIWFENMGNQTTTINSGFTAGWFKLNSLYTAANSTGKNYVVNVGGGGTGIELYNKIETVSGGGNLTINAATQLGANSEINAVGGSLTLGELRMNGKTLNTYGANSLNIQGAIIGTGTYNIKDQGTIVTYSGNSANTFSGITTVENSSQLRLNKSANTAAIGGHLVINSGGIVRTDAAEQLNNQFVTVNGTLNLNNQNQSLALTGSGSVTLGSGTITINNMNSDSFAGIISGTGGLIKTGTGTQTLSGGNSFTGKVQINQGTLSIGAESGLGGTVASLTADQLQFGGGTLAVNTGFDMSNNRGIALNSGGGTIDVASGQTLGIGGVITGANNLTKSGSGTLTLLGANNYTGDTRISAGNLTVSGSGNLGSGSDIFIASAGSLSVNVNTTVASLREWDTDNAGTVALGTGATLTVNGFDKGTMYQNSISGAGGLTMAGSGTSTLSLYGTQGYTGTTTVSGGKISSGVALSSSGITVSGGTFETSAANIVANTSTVNVSAGTYSLGGDDTVASLTISGGLLSTANSSTLTAETYALNGGTVSANLGAGIVNASSGTTLLSGTSAAANVNVSGGLLSLVSADRLANAAAVAVSNGELAVGANDTVGSLSTTGGTVSGTGTLTASTYALNGGTVSGNLGAGTVNASSGTTLLSGSSAAANVNVSGGTLNTSGANKLADGAAVAVSSGTLGVGGSDTVGSLAASGTGVVTVASGTTLTANGNSSITGSARATGGTVAIANNSKLTLANSSTTTTSDLSIGSGSSLAGTGGTSGQIKGSGLLSPGNSPGILTSGSVDLSGGIDFAFEFTAAGAPTYSLATNSKNDLLHLTSGSTPFSGSFSAGNTVSLYFNDAGLSASLLSATPTTYLGGFFVDSTFNIAGLLSTANMQYFIAAAGGTTSFNGVNYNLMSNEVASRMILSNVNQSAADFSTGTVNGTVLGVMAVPEPSSGSLLLAGIGSLLILRRFRKKA